MPFDDSSFDLVSVLGVLHHIPNVSQVLGECSRVLACGGKMILREPIVSMGDWRKPRYGLTKRERGIPIDVLKEIITGKGFRIVSESLCGFPPLLRVSHALGVSPFQNRFVTGLDAFLSNSFRWNLRYHAESFFQKIRPTSVFLVLTKDDRHGQD